MQYNGKCTRTLAYAIAALGVLRIRTPHSHNYSQILNSAPEKYAAESATRRCCSHSTHPATLLMQFSREMGTLHWATTIIAQCNVIAARRNELIPVNHFSWTDVDDLVLWGKNNLRLNIPETTTILNLVI